MKLRLQFGLLIALSCAVVSVDIDGASANTVTIDFTASGTWQTFGVPPFGLSANPSPLSGDVTIDTTNNLGAGAVFGASQFVSLDWVTGSKVWTLADISTQSQVYYSNTGVADFLIFFGNSGTDGKPYGAIATTNTVLIDDGHNGISCNGCVIASGLSPPPVSATPLPPTWTMMLIGLVGAGVLSFLRKKMGLSAIAAA
jgi:hypothetical protein